MKWVKASERVPDDWSKVICRDMDTNNVEWLDESTPDIEKIISEVFEAAVDLCDSYDDGFSFYEARKAPEEELKAELIKKYTK